MNRLLLLVISVGVFNTNILFGQFIKKGSYTVGIPFDFQRMNSPSLNTGNQGGVSLYSFEEENFVGGIDEYSFNQFFISSGYSYFLADNFSLGAEMIFLRSSSFLTVESSTGFFLSPELRYYLESPFFVSVAGNLSYANEIFDFNSVSFSAGYNFFVASDWALEPRISYTDLLGDEIRSYKGDGFMGEVSLRYFPGRNETDSTYVESALKKGNFMFGGGALFNFAQLDQTIIMTNPRVGYFLSENLLLGIGLNYAYEKLDFQSSFGSGSLETRFQALLGSIFARYYVYGGLFAELEGGLMLFNSAKVNGQEPEVWNPSNCYYNAGLGYSWFISPSIALEPGLRFGRELSSNDFESPDIEEGVVTLESVQQSFGLDFSIYVFLNR